LDVFVGITDQKQRGADFLEWAKKEVDTLISRKKYLSPDKLNRLSILKTILLQEQGE